MDVAAPLNPRISEHYLYKNRLQEYTQRSALPLPVYHTINEGSAHAPKFRSTVIVNGVSYRSPQTFPHRKEAEQDVAKLVLETISKTLENEGCLLIRKDPTFCKSILNEYAVKMNLDLPKYETKQSDGLLPVFVSSLAFDGVSYTGGAGKNKKEAEQMAARTVIESILGKSGSRTVLFEIINSKVKLYAALHKVRDGRLLQDPKAVEGGNLYSQSGNTFGKGKGIETGSAANELPLAAYSQALTSGQRSVQSPSLPELTKSKEATFYLTSPGLTGSEPTASNHPVAGGSSGPDTSRYEPVLINTAQNPHVHQLVDAPSLEIPLSTMHQLVDAPSLEITSSTMPEQSSCSVSNGVPLPFQTGISGVRDDSQLVPATVGYANTIERKRPWRKKKNKIESKKARTDT